MTEINTSGVFENLSLKLGCTQNKLSGSKDQSHSDKVDHHTLTSGAFSVANNTILPKKNEASCIDQNNNKMLNPNGLTKSVSGLSVNKSNDSSELGRNKIHLGKGYSLMDWIRFTKTTPDIAGNKGIMRQISYKELAQHNTQDDCWMAINNKVYNVTPYMKFHPGGIEEILKGAGMNATEMFNDVHPWVNLESMLGKCLIGGLVGEPPKSTPSVKSLDLSERSSKSEISSASETPTFDSYQTETTVHLVVYTRWKDMCEEFLTVDQNSLIEDSLEKDTLVLFIYIRDDIYKFMTKLNSRISENYKIKVNKEGKAELTLNKISNPTGNLNKAFSWTNIGSNLKFELEKITDVSRANFHKCEVVEKSSVTHDTDLYVFKLPGPLKMNVPLGYHVFIKFFKCPDHYPIKPYTVISSSFENIDQDDKKLYLMIKHYKDGYFTSKLRKIKIGAKVEISNFTGSFKQENFLSCKNLILICAGSGFTPMIRLISKALEIETIKKIKILFFNKSKCDILWEDKLNELKIKYANRVEIEHVLSQPDSDWTGHKGRITSQLFGELVGSGVPEVFFGICGPKAFTDLTIEFIKKYDYSNEAFHPFLS